jgi:hypothetical protein
MVSGSNFYHKLFAKKTIKLKPESGEFFEALDIGKLSCYAI